MSRKICIFLLSLVLLFPRCFAFANVEINEIMYDLKNGSDDGREWVEVFNNSASTVDISAFKFFEGNINTKTNHKLTLAQGDKNIGAKGYAVIVSNMAKFKTDFPNFFGTIFDSSFALSNDGETLALKDESLNIIDQYIYSSSMGAAGDGNSLQKINGSWVASKPTPGVENKIVYTPLAASPAKDSEPVLKKVSMEQNKNLIKTEIPVPIQNLPTNVLPSSPVEKKSDSYFTIIIFVLLLGISGGAVYFIRQKKITLTPTSDGSDFEILDE